MTPAETAKALCDARGGDFRAEVEEHLLTGYVFSTPDAFVMGRAVSRSGGGEVDAWFVHLAVGNWRDLLRFLPYSLPFIGWVRQGRAWEDAHWWPLESLLLRALAR